MAVMRLSAELPRSWGAVRRRRSRTDGGASRRWTPHAGSVSGGSHKRRPKAAGGFHTQAAWPGAPEWRVVLDWDGTVTEVDTLHLVLERFGDVEIYRRVENDLGRELTLHEVIAIEFATVRAPLDEVVAFVVETARVRAGFRELVDEFRPTVISSGFHELIRPVLAREGVEVDVVANTVEARPDGWRVRFRDEAVCATCGEACKRGSLPGDRPLVYVGDGYSDRCAALAADRVFATAGLARYLEARGVAFEPFADLHEVARRLSEKVT